MLPPHEPMPADRSITIVIPALNEEEQLEHAVRIAAEAAAHWFEEYEILIFDDGSTDRTGEIADRLARETPQILAFHHQSPQSIGGVLRRGLEKARLRYFMWADGKGATTPQAFERIFAHCGKADLVVPYAANQHERQWIRRVISRLFVGTLNLVFGLNLKQYTHLVLCETATARRFPVRTTSYAYQAEALIKMIKGGCTYVEVGVEDDFSREATHTKAFKPRNVLGVGGFLLRVVPDILLRRDRKREAAHTVGMHRQASPTSHKPSATSHEP
jgi:glycosyltransferase involved in cell wall biosynthesis